MIEIDLGSPQDVSRISATFLHDNNAWIFYPQHISFEVSIDGTTYDAVYTSAGPVSADSPDAVIRTITFDTEPLAARYVRIRAENIGRCPPWHKGSGGKAWVFIDEVEIQ
jgi:hypothetical protein